MTKAFKFITRTFKREWCDGLYRV